jgi:PEGA domain
MSKAFSIVCLVLLICIGGSALAKPKIAILGLEAAPGPNGAVDPDTTEVARDITKELRQRAQSGASPYVIAPNSNKELTDEKLLMSCDNEAVSCMVVIGAGLAADVLLYGRVERKGDVYRVSLKLLDVKAKTIQPGGDELLVGGSIPNVSKRLYTKLIGDTPSASGTLSIRARGQTGGEVSSGAVMVDEERKGKLVGGRLTVTGLAEGRHTVAIEAGGYQRFEESVTVHGGEQVSIDALLLEKSGPSSSSSQRPALWKYSLIGSLAVAAAGGGLAIYGFVKQSSNNDNLQASIGGDPEVTIGVDDCKKSGMPGGGKVTFDSHSFDRACHWHTVNVAGFVTLSVGGVGAVLSLIMLSRDPGSPEKSPTGARSKKPDVALAPVWMPGGGGASFSVRW